MHRPIPAIKSIVLSVRMLLLLAALTLVLASAGTCVYILRHGCAIGQSLSHGPWDPDYRLVDALNAAGDKYSPQWTPDGAHIVFSAAVTDDLTSARVDAIRTYVVASDGTDILQIPVGSTRHAHYYADHSPRISPDGSRVAYSSYESQDLKVYFDIQTAELDGTDRRRLTHNAGQDHSHVWSPSGRRIAFLRRDDYNVCDETERDGIYVMDDDSSDIRRIMLLDDRWWKLGRRRDGAVMGRVAWSPDEQYLAFAIRSQSSLVARYDLYAVKADGSEATRLLAREQGWLSSPAWSPDGQRIAFMGDDDGQRPGRRKLYTIDRRGGELREMTDEGRNAVTHGSYAHSVFWFPDGPKLVLVPSFPGAHRTFGSLSPDGLRIAVAVRYLPPLGPYVEAGSVVLYTEALDGSGHQVLATWNGHDLVAVDAAVSSTGVGAPNPEVDSAVTDSARNARR